MPKNKPLPTSEPESIEQAFDRGDDLAIARAVARKYARVLDMTDSGRDIKPLATGLFETIERIRSIESASLAEYETPYAQIMREAEAALANA